MAKIIRLTESELVRLVKRVINEDAININSTNNSQERLFSFMKGMTQMSSSVGQGWIPNKSGNGIKLTQNMLGNYFNQYRNLYPNKVNINEPLSWELYPLNPDLGRAKGVKCYITKYSGELYLNLEGGSNHASMIDATKGGGFLTTPGTVEKTLEAMQKIYDNYKIAMNPRQ